MENNLKIFKLRNKVEKLVFLEQLLHSFLNTSVEIISKNQENLSLYREWLEIKTLPHNVNIRYSTPCKNIHKTKVEKRIYTDFIPGIPQQSKFVTYILLDQIDDELISNVAVNLFSVSNSNAEVIFNSLELSNAELFLKKLHFPKLHTDISGGKQLNGVAGGYFELFDLGKGIIKSKKLSLDSFPTSHLKLCVDAYNKNFYGVIDGLVYIPSTKYGLLMDNFANEFSNACSLPILSELVKSEDLKEQKKLQKISDRHKNMIGAFRCSSPDNIRNKVILLLDDVWASGATMLETALYLYSLGAKNIFALVIAKKDRFFIP